MFHRYSFSQGSDDQGRTLLDSASALRIDIGRDAEGKIEVFWQVSGTVAPDTDPDDHYFHTTKDVRLVETLIAMFTAKRSGGDV